MRFQPRQGSFLVDVDQPAVPRDVGGEDRSETASDSHSFQPALRGDEAELHRFGVSRLYLFGAVAGNEAGPESDVDLFFDTDNPRVSLIELIDVQERVYAILGVQSDVMTRASLHPMLRQRIEAEALRVF